MSNGDNPQPSFGKRGQSHTNQAALIGMKFADEAIKSRATRRSNSTWSSSGSAGCPAGKVERRLVMIGVRLPEEGGPVGTIFPPASFGNLLPELVAISPDNGWVVTGSDDTTAPQG